MSKTRGLDLNTPPKRQGRFEIKKEASLRLDLKVPIILGVQAAKKEDAVSFRIIVVDCSS